MGASAKKKKKAAVNPARGFATTSIASKGKTEKATENQNDTSETSSIIAASTPTVPEEVQHSIAPISPKDRELYELTPDQLEAQLEHSDLQNAVEQQGPKARKESSRQISRLQADRRVLRSQAETLAIKEWLPDELMQQIIDLATEEGMTPSTTEAEAGSLKNLSEDAVLAKIWQLYLVLKEIDISEEQTHEALQYVLSVQPQDDSTNNVWGVSQVLDWLALHSSPGTMLDYEMTKSKARVGDVGESPLGKFQCSCPKAAFSTSI